MAKDPAFLFYPGDYLRDTQCLSADAQVAYDRIMCEHMRNICEDMINITISQERLDFFTKRLSEIDKEQLLSVLIKQPTGYHIEWVALSIANRKAYSQSRRKNRKGNRGHHMSIICQSYDLHMENEIENENNLLKEDNNKEDLIQKVWIQTWGRNPSLPEREETETLIKKFGIEKIKKEMKRANLKGFKNYGTFLERLDETGTLILDDRNNGQTQITTTLPTSKLSPDMEKQRNMLLAEKQKNEKERENKFQTELEKFKENRIDS